VKKQAVFILGPTATGKSQLALQIAEIRDTPIVNADSLQIYKGLDIGSAAPSDDDLERAPHYLYNYVDLGREYTAADYVDDVAAMMKGELKTTPLIFCGGSGFYIQALEKGMYELPKVTDEIRGQVQKMVDEHGWAGVHQWILEKDPKLQRVIHVNDQYRTRRALEMILTTQQAPTELQKKLTPSPLKDHSILKIALYAEKDVLRERVERRAKAMLETGFIEEVEALIAQGLSDWRPLHSVGYSEVCQFLDGTLRREDLPQAIAMSTMKLIKKQLTWFKRDPSIRWFHVTKLDAAQEYAQKSLAAL